MSRSTFVGCVGVWEHGGCVGCVGVWVGWGAGWGDRVCVEVCVGV